MKANEAPEKLYIALNELTEDGRTFVLDHRVDHPICTEYTRTDAFIKKAVNFLEMLGYGFTITDNITHTNYDKEYLVEDFKNYMKGE